MNIETVSAILGWSSLINIGILFLSAIIVVTMRSTITNIHASMFDVDKKDLGRAYFQYLGQYKIAIIMYNLAPWLALQIM